VRPAHDNEVKSGYLKGGQAAERSEGPRSARRPPARWPTIGDEIFTARFWDGSWSEGCCLSCSSSRSPSRCRDWKRAVCCQGAARRRRSSSRVPGRL